MERELFGNIICGTYEIQLITHQGGWFAANENLAESILGNEDLNCMLKNEYINEVVTCENWRPPKDIDVKILNLHGVKTVGKKVPI